MINKKTKIFFFIVTLAVLFLMTGCGSFQDLQAQAETEDNSITDYQDEVEAVSTNDSEYYEDIFKEAQLTIGKTGYRYGIADDGTKSSITDYDIDVEEEQIGNTGAEEPESEIIVTSWDEAVDYVEKDILYWVQNQFLCQQTDNISIVISDDNVAAFYTGEGYRVEVQVFKVVGINAVYFEFGQEYPSDLQNVHQFEQENGECWYCFSYQGYDEAKYQSAVSAKGAYVCDITFQNCDEDFIINVLNSTTFPASSES